MATARWKIQLWLNPYATTSFQTTGLHWPSYRVLNYAGDITEEEIELQKKKLLKMYEEEYEKAKFSDEYAEQTRMAASNWQGVAQQVI